MKMSPDAALFMVVEGRDTDHWFYEKLASKSPKLVEHGFQVWRIESFSLGHSANTGGKDAILRLRERLLALESLSVSSKFGKRSVMFCLDADHDRLTKSLVKCRHITYTLLPDAEAHVLDSVDIGKMIAAVMSLSDEKKREVLATIGDYRYRLAEKWAAWLQLCCLSGRIGSSNGLRPGTPGTAVNGTYGKITKKDLTVLRAAVIASSDFGMPEIARLEKAVEDEVRSLIAVGEARQLVKGKWLGDYLAYELNRYAKSRKLKVVSKKEIHAAARASAAFQDPWLSYFRRRATALIPG